MKEINVFRMYNDFKLIAKRNTASSISEMYVKFQLVMAIRRGMKSRDLFAEVVSDNKKTLFRLNEKGDLIKISSEEVIRPEDAFQTGTGVIWDLRKSVGVANINANKEFDYFPIFHLTGKFSDFNDDNHEVQSLIEIKNQYGEVFLILEKFCYQ